MGRLSEGEKGQIVSASSFWFPMCVSDYMGDTMHLDTLEHGAYILLLFSYYQNQGPLPDDDKRLASITRLSPSDWGAIRPVMQKFFVLGDGLWRNKRADIEIEKRKKAQEACKNGANQTNLARWGKSPSESPSDNSASRPASRSKVAILQSHSESTKHSVVIPETLNQEPFLSAWSDWRKHRVEIKHKLTPTCETKQLDQMAKLGIERATKAVLFSISKGWQGIFEDKDKTNGHAQPLPGRATLKDCQW